MKFLSLLLRILAIASLTLGIILLKSSISKETPQESKFGLLSLGIVLATLGAGLFNYSRKFNAKTWEEISRNDPRPPVLYLRSFVKDKEGRKTTLQRWWKKLYYTTTLMPANLTTQEEQLKIAFDDIGPMLAVAKPDSLLNDLGASRVKYKNEEWKKKVRELMQQAGLIVIRAEGDTEGLLWEINEVFKAKEPERIIFLLPGTQKEFDAFSNTMLQTLNMPLPTFEISSSVNDFSGLLYFDNNRNPLIEPINIGSFMAPSAEMFNHISICIKKALNQINSPILNPYKYEQVTIQERLKAFAYDCLLLLPPCFLVGAILILFRMSKREALAISFVLFIVLQLFYPLLWEFYSIKGTLGKRKLGFYISDKDHLKPPAQQIFVRCFYRFTSIIPFFFITIPYGVIAAYKKWPLIHDYLSRTRIFKKANSETGNNYSERKRSHMSFQIPRIFAFSKPSVNQFEFIDWVVEDRPFFYVYWEFKRRYTLRIIQLRRKYFQKNGLVLLSLPPSIDYVDIIISSGWRKIRKRIEFKKLKLDEQTVFQLEAEIKPREYSLTTNTITPALQKTLSMSGMQTLFSQKHNISMNRIDISIKPESLTYTNEIT